MQGAQQTLAVIFSSMCTIAILLEVVTGAPLVVAANRDEIYARPTRPPESLGEGIAGGVDALSGGTWLAIRRDGRFAAVTNQRALAPVPPGLRSRGLAVRELAAAEDPEAYVAALDPTMYASMNLVWGNARGVSIAYSRREGSLEIERLPPGIHVLCNDRLGAEGFPRGVRLHDAIAGALATGGPGPMSPRSGVSPAGAGGSGSSFDDPGPMSPGSGASPAGAGGSGSSFDDPGPMSPRSGASPTGGSGSSVDEPGPISPRSGAWASAGSGSNVGDASPELRWPDLVPVLQAALADHARVTPPPSHLPPEVARELTATCIHSPAYGTRSSTIVVARAGLTLAYLHADGPPCTAPFVDRIGLL
ncbi:MAG TPA: NRDE family protein [Kofleriaceae bacterium]